MSNCYFVKYDHNYYKKKKKKKKKILSDVPGRPVISNCGTPTEFVDFHLKPIMQNGWSYIRDSSDFINKIKNLKNIPIYTPVFPMNRV